MMIRILCLMERQGEREGDRGRLRVMGRGGGINYVCSISNRIMCSEVRHIE